MLFDLANLTYWIFLSIGIFLFLLVIISGGGEEQDLDTDADLDSDVEFNLNVDEDIELGDDLDADADADADANVNFLSILSWFGVGKVPLLILLAIDFSTWGVTGWFLNVTVGGFINAIPTGFLAIVIFLLSLIISLWVGKLLSRPIGKIFANSGEETRGDRLIGCSGHVTSKQVPSITEGRIAQADVLDNASNLVTVEICLPEWAQVIPHRGQEILIIEQRTHCYLAIAKDSSDQDKWLNSINSLKN